MKHKKPAVAAALYWFSVLGAYTWAAITHDRSGLGFLPFTALALPWTLVLYPVAQGIRPHSVAAAVYAIICILFSGANAVLLYGLIVAGLRVVGRSSRNS
jgi:hypothetical protein